MRPSASYTKRSSSKSDRLMPSVYRKIDCALSIMSGRRRGALREDNGAILVHRHL